jgi:hypothetical protein
MYLGGNTSIVRERGLNANARENVPVKLDSLIIELAIAYNELLLLRNKYYLILCMVYNRNK